MTVADLTCDTSSSSLRGQTLFQGLVASMTRSTVVDPDDSLTLKEILYRLLFYVRKPAHCPAFEGNSGIFKPGPCIDILVCK